MGRLVEMPARRNPARATEPGHSAAILFFTGVRYYRMEEAAPLAAAQLPPRERERSAPPPQLLA